MSIGGGSGKSGPTEEERALAERGALETNSAIEILLPVSDRLKTRLQKTAADRERVGSEASLASAQATAGDSKGRSSAAAPGSGNVVRTIGDTVDAATGATASGVAAGEQAVDNKRVKGDLRLAKAGRGVATEGARMLESTARRKTNEALAKAKRDVQRRNSILDTVGTAAGGLTAKYMDGPGSEPPVHNGQLAPDDGFRDF